MQAEVTAQIEGRKRSNAGPARNSAVIQITQLVSSRNLALRRNDRATVAELDRQIIELGGDPNTGDLAVSGSPSRVGYSTGGGNGHAEPSTASKSGDWEEKIQRINENNRKRTKEAMVAAHQAALTRKKAEEAIVRAKQWVIDIELQN